MSDYDCPRCGHAAPDHLQLPATPKRLTRIYRGASTCWHCQCAWAKRSDGKWHDMHDRRVP